MAHVPHRVHEGIVVCCDRRLRPTVDGLYNNSRRTIVSVAGANVRSAEATVRRLAHEGVKRWMVLTHTDSGDMSAGCGWAGRLEQEMAAGPDRVALPARYISSLVVEEFNRRGYTTRPLIEHHNLQVQIEALEEVLAGTGARVEGGATLDTAKLFTDDLLSHVLVVTMPSPAKYSSLLPLLNTHGSSSAGRYNTFYVQVLEFEEVVAEAKLLTGALHIRDVRLLPLDEHQGHLMARWAKALPSEHFMRGVGLTYIGQGTSFGRPRPRRRP